MNYIILANLENSRFKVKQFGFYEQDGKEDCLICLLVISPRIKPEQNIITEHPTFYSVI